MQETKAQISCELSKKVSLTACEASETLHMKLKPKMKVKCA